MWAKTNQARRDLLQLVKSSRTRAGALMVVAVVTIAATSTSPSSSTTTTSTSTRSNSSTSRSNQGGFLPSLHFWKRTGKDNTTSMQPKIPVAVSMFDRAAIERRTTSALSMLPGQNLNWFRLDDGIMGGQSSSEATVASNGILHFTGTINTNGGGFTSIRATLPNGSLTRETTGIKLRFRGDGKTYKLLLSDGSRGGGGARQTPSWQANVPTKKSSANGRADDEWQEMIIPLSSFVPNVGVGRNRQTGNLDQYRLDPVEMKQLGFMLSLLLADGQPNPPATFGSGIFDFSLQVQSIEPVME